jgi:hypothetical protein
MKTRAKRQVRPKGFEAYLHRTIEVRTSGGGAFRGELTSVDGEFLYLSRAIGRGAIIPRAAVAAILDEERYPAVASGNGGSG